MKTFTGINKAVVGKMKNESPYHDIMEAVSIKSKCYDFLTNEKVEEKDNKETNCHKKLKGIKKCVVKNDIKHSDYVDCVLKSQVKNVE